MDNTFLEAAMLVDASIERSIPSTSHYHACTAIECTVNGGGVDGERYLLAFREYFKPKHKTIGSPWFGEAMWWQVKDASRENAILLRNKEDRVMALLFMHEIAKDLPEFNKTI